MARRRGFFAELNHQAQLAERRRQQQAAAQYRANAAAQREAERAHRAAERARSAAVRATAAERKAAEREAARLYLESRYAEVAALNTELAETYAEIDGILAATLSIDDWVDLERLRVTSVNHPPFAPGELAQPIPVPTPQFPAQPMWQEPEAPRGLFAAKKRHAEEVARARAAYEHAFWQWQDRIHAVKVEHQARMADHAAAEQGRLAALAAARAAYEEECRQRDLRAQETNAELDELINGLAFDVETAIQEYVGIVLSNSVYPERFLVTYDYNFELATRELRLTVLIPEPSTLPTVKEYRYVKAKDEIVPTALPLRDQNERYGSAVAQVAVRSLHEVFEADRVGRVHSIALTVATQYHEPATGLLTTVPLVLVGADRHTFLSFDLAKVVPAATLEHLGASMSKNPAGLVAVGRGVGVRKQ